MMSCIDTIPVPDSRKKVDELFLFWLSEPSTQELLRNELSKVCGLHHEDYKEDSPLPIKASVTSVLRPGSPTVRSSSPPTPLSRSPKSPKAKRKPISPRRRITTSNKLLENSKIDVIEEVDFPTTRQDKESVQIQTQDATSPATTRLFETTSLQQQPHIETKTALPRRVEPLASPAEIPKFYFPNGRPRRDENVEQHLLEVEEVFQEYPKGEVSKNDFHRVVKAMNLPLYWKAPLFKACVGMNKMAVSYPTFKRIWQQITQNCHDEAARFVWLLAGEGRNYLIEDDFEALLQDIVDSHPGLAFLATAQEFHARYIETVIGRIFYVVDRSWNGQITASELRKSNFLQMLALLEEELDINQITDYFSYEHFYVVYCKFWELDTDHDLIIDAQDLARHSDHALTPRVISRVVSGVVTRDKDTPAGKLSYKDFVWFLLSEEDKSTPRSIEYWFRCMDLDGDGVLSLYELVYFYEEVLQKLQELNVDCLSIENTVCQILDMVNPREQGKISLRDLKACKMTSLFFNTFINVEKYLEYEQRDPVAAAKDESEIGELSDWDRYATEQYEILLAEEAYEQETEIEFEEDGESDLEEDEKEMLALLR